MDAVKLSPMRWFVILLITVCVLSLVLPPDPQTLKTLHISSTTYKIVVIFLLLPEALLWYAIFFAFAKIHEYSQLVKGSNEGRAFQRISLGMGALAFGLIIPSIISPILNAIVAHDSAFRPSATIINHYISLLVALISFSLLNSGSYKLIESGRSIKRSSLAGTRLFAASFIILAVLYSYTTLHTRRIENNAYYMSLYPLMITIIMPYLYAWFEGLVSAYNFRLYSQSVKGLLYKQAFFQLSVGLLITVIGFIIVQFITSTFGARTNKTLGFILVILYILLAILLAGLSLIALGTKKLKKIEEV
jgi:hypothetical protein